LQFLECVDTMSSTSKKVQKDGRIGYSEGGDIDD
jgi:hypothetical protein